MLYLLAKLQGKCIDNVGVVSVYILLFAFVEYSVYNTTRVKFMQPAYLIRENKTERSISQHRINSPYQDTTALQPTAILNGIYPLLVIIRNAASALHKPLPRSTPFSLVDHIILFTDSVCVFVSVPTMHTLNCIILQAWPPDKQQKQRTAQSVSASTFRRRILRRKRNKFTKGHTEILSTHL